MKLAFDRNAGPDLLVSRVVLEPLAELMHLVLHVDGAGFVEKRMAQVSARGQTFVGRGQYARSGALTSEYFRRTANLLVGDDHWHVLGPSCKTLHHSHKAFAMITRSAGVIFLMMHMVYCGAPWALFDIIQGDDEVLLNILKMCKHLQDGRARKQIKYNTLSRISGRKSYAKCSPAAARRPPPPPPLAGQPEPETRLRSVPSVGPTT